jgi:O-antigen/teichoic acid export membrane protein
VLPELSRTSSEKAELKRIMKNAISVGTFVIFPLLLGLCGVSNNFVEVFLTSKWNGCVPYIQLFCIIFAFYPLSTINLQAYNAIGKSDIYLYNEIAKKIIGIILLVVFIILWNSPMAVVASLLAASIPSYIIDARKSKDCFDYSIKDQFLDFLPNLCVSVAMFLLVLCLNLLYLSALHKLLIQVTIGAGFYFIISRLFKLRGYVLLESVILPFILSRTKHGRTNC